MPDNAADWPALLIRYLGEAISDARKAKKLSAIGLSEETAVAGLRVHRVAIPRIERGEQVVTVPELISLAIALDASWSSWLSDAAERAHVGEASGEQVKLERVLQALTEEVVSTAERISFISALLAPESGLPETIRDLLRAEVAEHVETLKAMNGQQEALQKEIERIKSSRPGRSNGGGDA